MSRQPTSPRPTPQPLCAVYSPLLPLLRCSELSTEEQSAVEAHLQDCAWCQNQLATYDAVDAALRSHYQFPAPAAAAPSRMLPLLKLEDIEAADTELDDETNPDRPSPPDTPSATFQLPNPQLRSTLAAIAATLLIAILAVSLFTAFGARTPAAVPTPTLTPGLDAQSRAYLNMLETYYNRVGVDNKTVGNCDAGYGFGSQSAEMPWMQRCQPTQAAFAADTQAFSDHLTLPPPPRWQVADGAFKQVVQEVVPLTAQGIAARTPDDLYSVGVQENTVMLHLCSSVIQINQDIVAARLPLSDLLPSVSYNPSGDCTMQVVG